MSTHGLETTYRFTGKSGFSLIEVIIAVALMAILSAIALPGFVQWRHSLEYRETARDFASALRLAKNQAIATNREQQVVFNSASGYTVQTGDRPYGATNWTPDPAIWTNIPSTVTFSPNTTIQFTPNGAALFSGTGEIGIKNSGGETQFKVIVTNTGRISVTR